MKLAAVLVLASLSSIPVQSQGSAPAAPAPEKKICKQMVPTGSIMGKRMCLTKAEWAELRARTEADAENTMRHRGAGTCAGEAGNPRCGGPPEQ